MVREWDAERFRKGERGRPKMASRHPNQHTEGSGIFMPDNNVDVRA